MLRIELTNRDVAALREAIAFGRATDDYDGAFMEEGRLPPVTDSTPFERWVEGLASGTVAIPASMLGELQRAIVIARENGGDSAALAAAERALKVPAVSDGTVTEITKRVAHRVRGGTDRDERFRLLGAEPSTEKTDDERRLEELLFKANGTLPALRFIEAVAFTHPDIDELLTAGAAWKNLVSPWQLHQA